MIFFIAERFYEENKISKSLKEGHIFLSPCYKTAYNRQIKRLIKIFYYNQIWNKSIISKNQYYNLYLYPKSIKDK